MGYFQSLAERSFQERDDGTVLFFPWGALGGAYVIQSRRRFEEIYGFCRRYLAFSIPTVVGVTLGGTLVILWRLGQNPRSLTLLLLSFGGLAAILWIYYAIRVRSLVKGLEESDERPDLPTRPGANPLSAKLNAARKEIVLATVASGVLLHVLVDLEPGPLGLASGAFGLVGGLGWRKWRSSGR